MNIQSVNIANIQFKGLAKPYATTPLKTGLTQDTFTKAPVETPAVVQKFATKEGLSQDKIEKLSQKYTEIEKAWGKDFSTIDVATNKFDTKNYVIQSMSKNNVFKMELLDKNFNSRASETVEEYSSGSKKYQIKKTVDYQNNTVSKVRSVIVDKEPIVTNEVKIFKDTNGKVQKTEYTEPSQVKGVYNIKNVYPDGKVEIVSEGKIDPKTGITTVRKNLTSLDGTKTEYLLEDDPKGNRISDYKITDKNGKVLLKNSQTFEVVSENKFISSKNNEHYEITLDDKNLKVKELKTQKETDIKLDFYIKFYGNREKVLESIRKMPGEEIIKMKQSVSGMVGIDVPLQSKFDPSTKNIYSSNNLGIILHELGHAVDFRDSNNDPYSNKKTEINQNDDLNNVFNKEKELFVEKFPNAQREHINYFIAEKGHYSGAKGGLKEVIAESNSILNTYSSVDCLGIRAQYLQQYFPKTIAKLSTLLNTYNEVKSSTLAEMPNGSYNSESFGH